MTPGAQPAVAPPELAETPGLPVDHVFESAARDGLVWLPEAGMGRLRVTEAPYDAGYLAKYEGYAATEQGQKITCERVGLVVRHHGAGGLVDIGIGCGDFVTQADCQGYDINPAGIAWLHSVGRWCDPYARSVDAISLWDTLEHIPNPGALLAQVRRFVFVSLPIVPGDGPPPLDWKHLRRDEHIWYWTHAGFIRWMAAHGFQLLESSRIETTLGREDIGSFAFQRAGA